ncbi:aminoglycoside 6-adenylyltransferase [Vagococcus fluvialis]|uniref:Aminoglycoside adenylyltransferase n=1 Tax=Vagococcus fluvialis TaxID=2738 RepID=A0A369ASQ8_9ENTE|nr:aminoglycoside 6-adenylyltransferase [Vagococcus fluvialis]MDT2781506.1 aminoglycoside 6-adenylyltransferase [Vagococcus fluvialis]RCX10494.1 aminoglycoside 6-adenylyltransferase [Vagococcus fluvialis]RST99008.1 aminoglycoside adenylyltransferase [Vagococcus fluvialis]
MRTKTEMLELFKKQTKEDNRIRLSVLEGSLTNVNIPKDKYQDYDVTFFVTERDSFLVSDSWLAIFGKVVFMQKPEDMTLFPPEFPKMYSYLMYLEDGIKIDLSLVLVKDLPWYLEESDGLVEVLVDKDRLLSNLAPASDKNYWLKKPNQAEFNDCLNEFWHVSAYVAKGLARGELLFAMDHLHNNIRQELLRMMSWHIGYEQGYDRSLGKNYKFIQNYLSEENWQDFLLTFDLSTKEKMEQSFWHTLSLFQTYSRKVSLELGFDYPNDEEVMISFIETFYLKR